MRPLIGLTSRTLLLRAAQKERPAETCARAYLEVLENAGCLCVVLPNPADPEVAASYVELLDGLVLTGGDDPHPRHFSEEPHRNIEKVDPRRDDFELALARAAHAADLPLLGICRGVQLLNIALGGDIYQDIASQTDSTLNHSQTSVDDGPWHEVEVHPGSLLERLLGSGRIGVNSFHHQACRRVAEGLVVSAVAAADGLVEALEDPTRRFCLGVQWHPEIAADAGSKRVFEAFSDAARERRAAASNGGRLARTGR